MLSVGREINIIEKDIICRRCGWEGIGRQLSAGLHRIAPSRMLLYAYRCPQCASFTVARKGKLLAFSIASGSRSRGF